MMPYVNLSLALAGGVASVLLLPGDTAIWPVFAGFGACLLLGGGIAPKRPRPLRVGTHLQDPFYHRPIKASPYINVFWYAAAFTVSAVCTILIVSQT
jgi:hypothetical protein